MAEQTFLFEKDGRSFTALERKILSAIKAVHFTAAKVAPSF